MNPGLGTILFFTAGYVLVYASVANHGRFAAHPWAGVIEDAYTGETFGGGGAASSSSSSTPAAANVQEASLKPAATVQRGYTVQRGHTPPRNRLAVVA